MKRALRLALLTAALTSVTPSPAGAHDELPLGPPHLQETRTARWIAPGVTRTLIVRGASDPDDGWAVDVDVKPTRREARAVADRLSGLGHLARIELIGPRAPGDPERRAARLPRPRGRLRDPGRSRHAARTTAVGGLRGTPCRLRGRGRRAHDRAVGDQRARGGARARVAGARHAGGARA